MIRIFRRKDIVGQVAFERQKVYIGPLRARPTFRDFARETIENAVQKLFDAVSRDKQLRAHLHLQGSITFENHTNLGDNVDDMSASVEQLALVRDGTNTTPAPKRAQKAKRGKSGLADQFCVYRRSYGQNTPALAIEYKAPRKLTREEVVTGLRGEIQPARDIISQHGDGVLIQMQALHRC
ncbi:hypothetical protein F5Y17DRAFT_464009 [Xylariaceae sp. FL0594]|nr:hypothetical protein F5Y17DRAFT_464009 [Xylariaceae sp. FL0594]